MHWRCGLLGQLNNIHGPTFFQRTYKCSTQWDMSGISVSEKEKFENNGYENLKPQGRYRHPLIYFL